MKTYDVILFFNELDLLELRLETLHDVVDTFVIVEGTRTFSGNLKPLNYKNNQDRFSKWESKIRYIVYDEYDPTVDAWEREHRTRDYTINGLYDAQPDDLIFFSDCDEIWNPDFKLKALDQHNVISLGAETFFYFLNCRRLPRVNNHPTLSSKRFRYKYWTTGRELRHTSNMVIPGAGWHFSYLGGAAKIADKLKAFSHQELNNDFYTDLNRLNKMIETGEEFFNSEIAYKPVPIDMTFPKPIINDYEKWKKFIKPLE